MSNKGCTNAVRELAPLYAIGALNAEEQAQFEEHLAECAACAADMRAFEDVASSLGSSVPAEPPPELRERLMAKIHGAPQVPGLVFEDRGLLVSRSEEMAWRQMGPGIEVKLLYRDPARKYHTSLVRMEAGAHYPSHRHREIEELFVLSGELFVEGQTVRAGDYCRAESGTIHGETFTGTGAMFLLMASQLDEMVA